MRFLPGDSAQAITKKIETIAFHIYHAGEVAPFPLVSYEDVRSRAKSW